MIVENKPGASTIIATDLVAKSTPDGYTVLLNVPLIVQTASLFKKLPYDPLTDLLPVAQLNTSQIWFAVGTAKVKATTFKEYIAQAKADPKNFSYASIGPGSTGHQLGFGLNEANGLDTIHVPYKGSTPALQVLLQPFDPVNLAVSALAGAAFGGIFHRGRAAERTITPEEHAAALVMNEARTRDAGALARPGDIEAATLAHDAQARAREQLDRGEMVSVAQGVRPDWETVGRLREGVAEQLPAETRRPDASVPIETTPAELPAVAPVQGQADGAGILDKVREAVGQFFGRQEPEAKPATPEQARAAEIASRTPDAVVRLEDGSEVRMADLLQRADVVEATAKTERAAFEAAVNCAVRYS